MFCNQCEQTARHTACTKTGVCGKTPEVDALQDLLVYMLQGVAEVAKAGISAGVEDGKVGAFTCEALFATLTNVNFDPEDIRNYILQASEIRDLLKERVAEAGASIPENPWVILTPPNTMDGMVDKGREVELKPGSEENDDILSLKLTALYALKGVAAYTYHAIKLGKEDPYIYRAIYDILRDLGRKDLTLESWLDAVLKVGETNLRAMELLDRANTEAYGNPIPTNVPLGAKVGPAVLVSGHDLKDLHELLTSTQDKGILVYTHGEMLPAHGYPGLKAFPNLHGHYGTAWQNQTREFAEFPGPVVMTTNCLMPPKESYRERVFTMGPVGYPGLKHIKDHNFEEVVATAIRLGGFKEDREERYVKTGFAREAVLKMADRILDAIGSGKIRHLFLVGGCDGAKPGRNYYTRFVEMAPEDTVILTLGCGKFRFFDKDLGSIGEIPRLLDVGQCNDAYSAIQIALALSKATGLDINELPLSLIVSWYEQKAVAILLTLLHLGIKNIRLGPTLPAFLSPNVLKLLSDRYNIMPISTPEEDLKNCLKS